jgi:hypothetical protein
VSLVARTFVAERGGPVAAHFGFDFRAQLIRNPASIQDHESYFVSFWNGVTYLRESFFAGGTCCLWLFSLPLTLSAFAPNTLPGFADGDGAYSP